MGKIETGEKRESFNKTGRKKAGEAERIVVKTVRFNKEELRKVMGNAAKANLEFSEFIRTLALNPKIVLKQKDSAVVEGVHSQILKMGINLNQIARALNSQYEPHNFSEITRNLEEITKGISALYDEVSK